MPEKSLEEIVAILEDGPAILSIDWGSQGMTAVWKPVGLDYKVIVSVDFEEFGEYTLTDDCIIPPEYKGQAFQPVEMYLKAFELLINRTKAMIGPKAMKQVKLIAMDGQQHGSTYWNASAANTLANIRSGEPLAEQLGGCLASPWARNWMTSSSTKQRQRMTEGVGSIEDYVKITGSQPYERYTGTVIADLDIRQPEVLPETAFIRLIEQIPWMLITGDIENAPLGWGGACGTAIWNYKTKNWDDELVELVLTEDSKINTEALYSMLPGIVSPGYSTQVSPWFASFAGVADDCIAYEPAGDNPGARVIIKDRLVDDVIKPSTVISLGTSITVNKGLTDEIIDTSGKFALMYDYIGRPFAIGCKTNGMARVDEVLKEYGVVTEEGDINYKEHDEILASYITDIKQGRKTAENPAMYFRYIQDETFPETKAFVDRANYSQNKITDIIAVTETMLADIAVHVGEFLPEGEPIFAVGGGSNSDEILYMLASMLKREVILGGSEGAAFGDNYAAEFFHRNKTEGGNVSLSDVVGTASEGKVYRPIAELVNYYHGEDGKSGYLKEVREVQKQMFSKYN